MTPAPDTAAALDVRWASVFADVPAASLDRDLAFWAAVAGAQPGDPSGRQGEFVPLQPPTGDRYLWLQRIGDDHTGWHLDLHVPELAPAVAAAGALGARLVRHGDELATLTSPGGLPFCLAVEGAERSRSVPAPSEFAGGHTSRLDQLCLDLPAAGFEAECDFWATLTGWPRTGADAAEFDHLAVPGSLPLRVLLQRLGADDGGPIRAHADLCADARAPEVARHVELGATLVVVAEHWTTLRDPAGLIYCVTDRRPATES